MRVAVIGAGAVGVRAARQLAASDEVDHVTVRETDADRVRAARDAMGEQISIEKQGDGDPIDADVAILATPAGTHVDLARRFLARGTPVVSLADGVHDVRALLDLDAEARERHLAVVIGAGFSPGLSCVLARHAAADFDEVDEIHVAKIGTGGPACARQHHRALAGTAVDWRDGGWQTRPAGSGRELCWFPDPVGAADCYRASLPDSLLLASRFPGVSRVTSRLAATRRDRLTSWLPMLRPPHPEGGPGAIRVEVRGRRGTSRDVRVLGAMDRPAVAAGAVAAVAAVWAATGRLTPGAGGLASVTDTVPFLADLGRRGVRAAVFEGLAA